MSRAVRNITGVRKNATTPPYEIIIPTAGSGNRMKCHGPKSLIRVGKETILTRQLKMIQKYMVYNPQVILIAGFEFDKIMKYTPRDVISIENNDYENTNVVRSIGMGLRATQTECIIILYGDLVFNQYALSFPIINESVIVVDTHNTMSSNEVGCIVYDGYVKNLWYDLPDKWAQIVLLTGQELELAKNLCWDYNNYNSFGFEMLNKIIEKGGKFKAFRPHKMKINDIDSLKDITNMKTIVT